jgi:hypothetical protein
MSEHIAIQSGLSSQSTTGVGNAAYASRISSYTGHSTEMPTNAHGMPKKCLLHTISLYMLLCVCRCIMLCADHGPCVSGAHNAIVTSRAGKDLVSCLVSGLLTIGPRFGGAIDDAARCAHDGPAAWVADQPVAVSHVVFCCVTLMYNHSWWHRTGVME